MEKVNSANLDDQNNGKKHHWSANLIVDMKNPLLHIREDDRIVVIKDKYPKAEVHYLILPKEDISSIWHVTKEHESLLLHMNDVAEDLLKNHPEHEFIYGYHASPSMERLHLHVISTDFNSKCLKTVRHWNDFTTPLFMSSKDICKQLNEGKLKKMSSKIVQKYLRTPLKCHKCSTTFKSMELLKVHLLMHLPK